MQLIEGRKIADDILTNIKSHIEDRETKPTLAVILIGKDEASKIYVGLKEKAAKKIGFNFFLYKYDANVKEEIILEKIKEINDDNNIDGVIVQLPLPDGLDKNKIINAISPKKDVDGFCDENQKCFSKNQATLFPVFPKAIIKMVESVLMDLEIENETPSVLLNISPLEYKDGEETVVRKFNGSKLFKCSKAIIICKSDDFGLVMQEYFRKIKIKSQYFMADKIDENKNILREADIVVVACGVPNLLNSSMIKDDVIIIDGGINKVDGKTVGDVDTKSFENTNAFISPVPGGVGPVTVACLLENVYLTHYKSTNLVQIYK